MLEELREEYSEAVTNKNNLGKNLEMRINTLEQDINNQV